MTTSPKTLAGNFFEDFRVGQEIQHATPRTLTEGDVSLYIALYGSRFAVNSSVAFAQAIGLPGAPVDDLLAFHIVLGKTVPDLSLNAIANLGYASGRFGALVYPGDTLSARTRVLGVKENRDGRTGVVYVRSVGRNQRGEMVVDYCRWVMVRKRDPDAAAPEPVVPELAEAVDIAELLVPPGLHLSRYDAALAGGPYLWDDYQVGERIDHLDGMTLEEADHMLATRLYQNTARVHFNQHLEKDGRFGRRIIYGGHIISLARCLSFNGLANAFRIAAINAGRHVAPSFAGDTIYAWTEVLDKLPLPDDEALGTLRLRTLAAKDHPCGDFPYQDADSRYHPAVVLDFDYRVLLPRRI